MWIFNSNNIKMRLCENMSADLLNQDVRIDLLWKAVRYEQHKQCHWTWHIVKHRGEIHGTGKKLRQQKGTGRARMSDGKAPQFKNGGQAHGRRPRSKETHLKKTMYVKAIKVALTARYKEGDLLMWEDFVLPRLSMPKTNSENENNVDSLIPIDALDANDNTKLYADVHKARQMLNKFGWLKPQLHKRINDNKTFEKITNAKKSGNIVDILESMPISDFEWDFLKEEDELCDETIPSVLMIHDGFLHDDFERAIDRINGVELMCWEDIVGEYTGDGKRHTPRMGINKLLKFKKIVFSVTAFKNLENNIGIEAEIERWNYYAELNRIKQSEQ